MAVPSFVLFAYVITILNILEKALINMSAVLESYLFSVIYLKTSSSIFSLSYSEKSEYFQIFTWNSLSNSSRTLSSGVSKCIAKQFAVQWPSLGIIIRLTLSSSSTLTRFFGCTIHWSTSDSHAIIQSLSSLEFIFKKREHSFFSYDSRSLHKWRCNSNLIFFSTADCTPKQFFFVISSSLCPLIFINFLFFH